jgi:hypothetical protein
MHMLNPQTRFEHTVATAPTWKYSSSVYLPKHHCVIYRDDALGIQKQVMTRRWTFLFQPREREFYFIDGDKRTFRSEERLMSALRARTHTATTL